MRITIPKPTLSLIEGDLVVNADSLTIETPRGSFELVLLAGGGIALNGPVVFRAADDRTVIVEFPK